MVRGLFLWRYNMSGLSTHILEEMAKKLEKAGWLFISDPELPKDYVIKQAAECMGQVWQDKIAIVWDVDDVLTMAHPGDAKEWMTKDEAVQILCYAANKHDASLGITWDTLDYYVQDLKSEKEKII